jgi:hypothetical protein
MYTEQQDFLMGGVGGGQIGKLIEYQDVAKEDVDDDIWSRILRNKVGLVRYGRRLETFLLKEQP